VTAETVAGEMAQALMGCYCPHCFSAPGKPLTQEYPPNSSRLNRKYSQALPERTRTTSRSARPTGPRGPQRAGAPRPPSASPPAGRSSGVPSPARSVTSTRTTPSPGNDRHRDRLPGSTRAGVPDTITEDLADQQDGHLPARVPRAEYLRDERTGGPRLLRPPGKRDALPDRQPSHHRTRTSRPPRPGKPPGQRADAGTGTLTSAQTSSRKNGLRGPRPCLRPPSVAVREKADGAHRPS
jgi:hypothetical protein